MSNLSSCVKSFFFTVARVVSFVVMNRNGLIIAQTEEGDNL